MTSTSAAASLVSASSNAWLRLCARYTYGVTPQDATFAAGPVLLSNSSGTPRSFAIGALELECSITRARYLNTAAVTVGAGAVDVEVACQAVEAGSASSALQGELDTVIDGPAGITCRNDAVLVGLDDEGDTDLESRCGAKLQPFSPDGPNAAYWVAARGALRANGTNVGVNRLRAVPRAHGRIDVFAATPAGGLTGTIYDLGTDLGVVDEAIQTQAVPLTVTANVYGAVNRVIDVSAQVWVYNTTGTTEAQVDAAIRAALVDYFASPLMAPIGGNSEGAHGYIWAADIRATIMRAKANGAQIRAFKCVLASPGDISIGEGEVPTLGTVTLEITRTAPPAGSI